MKNVVRPDPPMSLRNNAVQWTKELLAELRKRNRSPSRLAKLWNRYKRQDVRDALEQMYHGLCCYCEAQIGVVAFSHIEHRRPKRAFPRYTFRWQNLHLGCEKCNNAKGNKWSTRWPILDAVDDTPIARHLIYELRDVLGATSSPLTRRGRTTIDAAKLNREPLRNARTKVAVGVVGVIVHLNEAPDSLQSRELLQELREKAKGEYGSLVEWLLGSLLRPQPRVRRHTK